MTRKHTFKIFPVYSVALFETVLLAILHITISISVFIPDLWTWAAQGTKLIYTPGIKYFVLKLHISKCVRSVSMYNSYRLQLNKQTWNYILQSTYWFHWWLECILCTPRYTQTHWWKLVITICTGHIGILHQHETCREKKLKYKNIYNKQITTYLYSSLPYQETHR